LYIAIGVLLIFFLGFGVAKMTTTVKTKVSTVTSYVPSPYPVTKTVVKPVPYSVHDSVEVPKPYAVHDTVKAKVDTAAIMADYNKVKKYALDFSNDTLGIFKVNATVYRNELAKATSIIQPIIKTTVTTKTIYKVPLVQFYGLLGSSVDFKTNKLSIGFDLKQKYMVGVSGVRFNNQNSYTIDAGIKF